jgi:hypothetical protein
MMKVGDKNDPNFPKYHSMECIWPSFADEYLRSWVNPHKNGVNRFVLE